MDSVRNLSRTQTNEVQETKVLWSPTKAKQQAQESRINYFWLTSSDLVTGSIDSNIVELTATQTYSIQAYPGFSNGINL